MADNRSSSRHAAYSDVFGGPPKYSSAPFAAKPGDYGEIFGGMASCSIPFLDLPPESDGGEGFVDYGEIFGGPKGDIGIDYEELVKMDKSKGEEASCSNGRIPKQTEFGQKTKDISWTCRESAFGEKNHIPAKSEYSEGISQVNMSFNKVNQRSMDDTLGTTIHVTELHAVPGYISMINSCSPVVKNDKPPKVAKNAHVHSASSERGVTGEEQGNIIQPSSHADSTNTDMRTQQKQFTNYGLAPEEAPSNVRSNSCSSSYRSSSSGDVSFHDATRDVSFRDVPYVTISNISLQTQPSHVPPPSRAPPKLDTKQGLSKKKSYGSFVTDLEEGTLPKNTLKRQTHYSVGVPNKVSKDGSPFFDVEVDAKSAAAASAAAMKEAMEQAQARLKAAKDLMERKREKLHSRKKMSQEEVTIFDERPEYEAVKEAKSYTEVNTKKTLLDQGGSKKEINFGKKNAMMTMKAASTEEKETYVMSSREDRELMQHNGFKKPLVANNPEEITGEWKTDGEFYELVKSDNNPNMVQDKLDVQKNAKSGTNINEFEENYPRQAALSCEVEICGKSQKVEDTSDAKFNDEKYSFASIGFYDKIREIPNTILKACSGKENVNRSAQVLNSLQQMRSEKNPKSVQEDHVNEYGPEGLNAIEGTVQGGYASQESKISAERFNQFKFDGVTLDDEEERKKEAAEEPCGYDIDEKELSGTSSVSVVTLEAEMMKNKVDGAGMRANVGNEAEMTTQSCMSEVLGKLEADGDANQCESHQKVKSDGNPEYGHKENGYEVDSSTALEEENQRQKRPEEVGIHLQQSQGVEVTNQDEAGIEKVVVQDTLGHSACEKVIDPPEVAFQHLEEVKTSKAEKEIDLKEKQQYAAQTLPEEENCDEAMYSEGTDRLDTVKVGDVHISLGLEEIHKKQDAARVSQSSVHKDVEFLQQPSLLEKKLNVQSSVNDDFELHPTTSHGSAQDTSEPCQVNSHCSVKDTTDSRPPLLSKNAIHNIKKVDKKENYENSNTEIEQGKEQAKNLEEEERERQREREKDRLAVERVARERIRAERIAVERVTEEARQRALAEAREKAEKASAEALQKSLAEKALKDARLRAERAAVERATAEARERAVEKALAEKAASDARQRADRQNATSRDYRTTSREDRDAKLKPNFANAPHEARFQSSSSSNSLKQTDSYVHGDDDSPLRCKAKLERHQRTVERAAKALAEKNMRDVLAQREQAERNRLSDMLDAEVRRWSTGKEGNLRALLSTLQYILGPDSGWQPVPLTDVITAVAVKKAYRKATLCVHPDKVQQRGANIQQKYICEKVFDLLKDAWSKFNSEER